MTSSTRVLLGALALPLLPVLGLVLAQPGSGAAQTAGDLAILTAVLLACAGCARAARSGGPARRAWAVLAVATGVWAAGQLCWTVLGLTRDHAYPFPSPADAGFLGYALPAVVGLLLFPRSSLRQTSRARLLLDAGVIAASVLLVSWATVLGPLYDAGGEGLPRLLGLAYPVVDVTVASLVLALGARVAPGQRGPWLLLGSGLVLLTRHRQHLRLRHLPGRHWHDRHAAGPGLGRRVPARRRSQPAAGRPDR